MQSPTPPTKPTPPTPPSLKTSSTATTATTDTTPSPTVAPQTKKATKETVKTVAPEQATSNPEAQPATNAIPLGSYSNSSSNTKETTAETKTTAAIPANKNKPSTSGITIFMIITLVILFTTVVVHWLKNNKPKKQSTINYSTESSDDIVDLILSKKQPESATQVMPKTAPKKLLLKPATKPKKQGGFEVRI